MSPFSLLAPAHLFTSYCNTSVTQAKLSQNPRRRRTAKGKYLSPRNQVDNDEKPQASGIRVRSSTRLQSNPDSFGWGGELPLGAKTSLPSNAFSCFAFSALHTFATFITFSLPFPGACCLFVTPDVDYRTQHSSRQVDFRVKKSALGISPWKRSVWSRGAPGYARWLLWGLELTQGPFCRRQPP